MSKDRPAWADAGRRSDDNFPPRPHIPDSMMDQRFRNMRCRRTGRCQSARRKAELGDVRCGRECGAFFSILFFFFFSARIGVASKRVVTAVQSNGGPVEREQRSRRSHSLTRSHPTAHTLCHSVLSLTLCHFCALCLKRDGEIGEHSTLFHTFLQIN